jgi:hypothetical protein
MEGKNVDLLTSSSSISDWELEDCAGEVERLRIVRGIVALVVDVNQEVNNWKPPTQAQSQPENRCLTWRATAVLQGLLTSFFFFFP